MRKKILSVDDDTLNRDILTEYLTEGGYEVVEADDGDTALALLNDVEGIEAIVLDRMMPRMNGMEVLKAVKRNPALRRHSGHHAIRGDRARPNPARDQGRGLLLPHEAIRRSDAARHRRAALQDAALKKKLRAEVSQHRRVMGLMEQPRFRFRTPEEARNLAFLVANCFPEPEAAVYGLNEMLINAVEHGNLGITYDEKTQLILEGRLRRKSTGGLLVRRTEKSGPISASSSSDRSIRVRIKDRGAGFDWRQYLDISPERATHPHGRGIATSRLMSFTSIEYLGCGNEVLCTVDISAASA